jgi:nucleotide-binding universal stress UspA family protein
MKTLIVPTDFSPVSINALHYAINLAKDIFAKVVLFHAYQVPIAFSEVPVVTISMEEMKAQTDERMEDLTKSVEHLTSGTVPVSYRNTLGETMEELEAICRELNPYAVIMGTRGAGAVETLFMGSTTIAAVNRLHVPVIIVPPGARYKLIRKIGFACDYSSVAETTPIKEIIELCRLFNASLHVLNVDYKNKHFTAEVPMALTKVRELLEPVAPKYHYIEDQDVEDGVNRFAETHGIDLIITIPKKHKLLERIFQRSHTRDLALHAHIPIAAIHE